MTGEGKHEALEPVVLEAMDRLLRLTSGSATSEDARELAAWRARDPAHDAAFRDIAALRRLALALPREAVPQVSADIVPDTR